MVAGWGESGGSDRERGHTVRGTGGFREAGTGATAPAISPSATEPSAPPSLAASDTAEALVFIAALPPFTRKGEGAQAAEWRHRGEGGSPEVFGELQDIERKSMTKRESENLEVEGFRPPKRTAVEEGEEALPPGPTRLKRDKGKGDFPEVRASLKRRVAGSYRACASLGVLFLPRGFNFVSPPQRNNWGPDFVRAATDWCHTRPEGQI